MYSFRIVYLLAIGFASGRLFAQTNSFPSSGNVGIGTMNPQETLHVNGRLLVTGNTEAYIQLQDNVVSGHARWRIMPQTNNSTKLFRIFDEEAWADRLVITAAGNVGIGTNSPARLLHVNGTMRLADGGALEWGGTGAAISGTSTSNALLFSTGSTERMRVSDLGYVGIGTTSPSADLHIRRGSGTVYLRMDTADAANLIQFQRGQTVYNSIASPWAVPGDFAIFDNVGNAVRFYIATNGNVGIGTTSPTQRLAVNGTVKAKEVIVEATGWSDYVFAKDYRLAPLSEIEQHIQKNGHLPDVPSAADVAARGVDVGEMQKILLQKIEELTLHVIRFEKENSSLRADVTTLKAQSR
jgi:hypothetical protein